MDDTGARHARQNGFCTQIGNDRFTWFATRASKSRLNFLDLLRAGHTDYVINDAALSYMRGRSLAGPVISQFAAQPRAHFANALAWQAHLDRLGISALHVTPDPVQIATEGALWAAFMPTASCATPSSSAMMPVNLTLADMRCVGSTQSDWCISSTPSPSCTATHSSASAGSSGG